MFSVISLIGFWVVKRFAKIWILIQLPPFAQNQIHNQTATFWALCFFKLLFLQWVSYIFKNLVFFTFWNVDIPLYILSLLHSKWMLENNSSYEMCTVDDALSTVKFSLLNTKDSIFGKSLKDMSPRPPIKKFLLNSSVTFEV